MQKLRMEHIYKSYGQAVVLQDFSYAFTQGGITCIMGESGAGKTTLLRLLMGLEKADSGIITGFDKVSAVFQENRLIEHLNAVENTALVIKDRNAGKCAYEQLLQLLPKEALLKPVREYSGGMKRRVALVRAMAADSEIVLLDEPFTAKTAKKPQNISCRSREAERLFPLHMIWKCAKCSGRAFAY